MYSDNYFDSDEFKQHLRNYEEAKQTDGSVYMEPDDFMDIAQYYHMQSRFEEAMEVTEQALALFPDAVSPLAYKARLALNKEDNPAKAQTYVDRIADKSDWEYFYLVAEIMMYEDRDKEADEYLRGKYEEETEGEDREAFIVDVTILFCDYDYYDIAYDWLHMLPDKSTTEYQELLAKVFVGKGQYEEAERIFNGLIDKDPFSSSYWNQLANAQFLHNDLAGCISSSEYALAINPDDEEALLNRGNALFALGNNDEALKLYQHFSEIRPQEEVGYLFQAVIWLRKDNVEEAKKCLRQAEGKTAGNVERTEMIDQELILQLSAHGLLEEALSFIDSTIYNYGDRKDMLVLRGYALLENGRTEEARENFQQAAAISNDHPSVLLSIAVAFYDNGYTEQSYTVLQKMFDKVDENWANGYSYMALCARKLGRHDDYIAYLKKAGCLNPLEARTVLGRDFPDDADPADYYKYVL